MQAVSEEILNPVTIGSLLGNLGLGWQLFRHVRRSNSSDKLAVNRDTYEDSLLRALQEQSRLDRERADRAEHERNQAIIEVGQLKGQVQAFSLQLQVVQKQLEDAHEDLSSARDEIRQLRETLQQLIERRAN